MTAKDILALINSKNQHLPKIECGHDFKRVPRLYVPVFEGEEKTVTERFRVPKGTSISGHKDRVTEVIARDRWIRFEGQGARADFSQRRVRRYFGRCAMAMKAVKVPLAGIWCEPEWVMMAAAGVLAAGLSAKALFPGNFRETHAFKVVLTHPDYKKPTADVRRSLEQGTAIAHGKNLVRLLGALPPNQLHPQVYADVIQALAKAWKMPCARLTEAERRPYELLNGVSLGSAHHSELLCITVHPKSGPTKQATALIGKGICFDSGGLNLKPSDNIRHMKEDMNGSAILLATLMVLARDGFPVKETTHFVLPLAENMSGSSAIRPDDVWTAGDGQTVEIGNTDAEGRLILADAICYVKKQFSNVRRYVTVATLTGSCLMALGDLYTGMLCTDEKLSQEMVRLGQETGDLVHAGPFDMDYDDYKSAVADLPNYGENPREAGWIKGAIFLRHFLPKHVQFCHLDIAGSIDMSGKGKPWRQKGLNSGVAVGMLSKLVAGER